MLHPKVQQLADARAQIAALESEIAQELASLHAAYGFDSVDIFIAEVKSASRGKGNRGRPAKKPAAKKKRTRAVITAAIRAKVKKLVKAGRTGSQIAKALKISVPSVQNIKKALGLVKTAKKKPVKKAKARKATPKKTAKPKARKKRVRPKKSAAAPKAPPAPVAAEPAPTPPA